MADASTSDESCAACGGRAFAPLVAQRGYAWHRCGGCGMARLMPWPNEADTAFIAGDAIGEGYIRDNESKLGKKLWRARKRLFVLKRLMPGRRFLDVGSNVGAAVEAARRAGLEAVGIEINPRLVAYARATFPACIFLAEPLERADPGGRRFDGMMCAEVIEHVPDQDGFVGALAGALNPRGVLYLTTPALHEYVGAGAPATWRDFGAPDHKLYHTRDSLARLFAKHGFGKPFFLPNGKRGWKMLVRKGG